MPVTQPSTLPLSPCVMNVTPPAPAESVKKMHAAASTRPPLPSPLLQRRRGRAPARLGKHSRGGEKRCAGSRDEVAAPEEPNLGVARRTPAELVRAARDMDRASVKLARSISAAMAAYWIWK